MPEVGELVFGEEGFLGVIKEVTDFGTYYFCRLAFNDGECDYVRIPKT